VQTSFFLIGLSIYLEYGATFDLQYFGELWVYYLLTDSETRLTDPDYARGYKTMCFDGFPFLIA
jgi:hypothetical protein